MGKGKGKIMALRLCWICRIVHENDDIVSREHMLTKIAANFNDRI